MVFFKYFFNGIILHIILYIFNSVLYNFSKINTKILYKKLYILQKKKKKKKGYRYNDFPRSPLPKYYHYLSGLTSVFG